MADRNLTLEEFLTLPLDAKCRRYQELSDRDKCAARKRMDPGVISPPCNDCIYYRGKAKCEAYPNGISGDHIQAVMDDLATPCGESFRYQKKRSTNVR